MRKLKIAIAALLLMLTSSVVADATSSLQHFFSHVHSFEASFDQTVLDEGLNVLQESTGHLYLERPDRFRWDYDKPYKQHIVADGKKIWVYDVELSQVTVRQLSGGLASTPATLLAGTGKLEKTFHIKNLGRQGKLDWVQLIPRNKDGGFEDIRVGFEGSKLRQLDMIDGLGQTTRVILRDNRENPKISKKRFTFTVPKGVDVVKQ
ncbi:MAG: outer membrane lipoprotein chaperone LolA [Acidiferrobacteraceae bacterium]|jgi:outer membrane lipoprotein carrier protein